MLKNFPDSTLGQFTHFVTCRERESIDVRIDMADPWTVLETWGPTASGAEGFTVVVPVNIQPIS